jgi:cytosine/adenosine deaminase-related metal-dependent hydrolase
MGFVLKNLQWYNGEENVAADFFVNGNTCTIHDASNSISSATSITDCRGAFVYPGLINAHDHLEMNLYPKLGSPPYQNYVEWANDIYKPEQSPLKEIEKVPIADRLLWGGLKNIISGVTTVVHHNPWHRMLGKKDFPVEVLKDIAWAHSIAFTKQLKATFPKKKNIPFVIHAAEGIDEMARQEVTSLLELGLITPQTVLVHGVGITASHLPSLVERNPSLVWCPSSNHYMFSTTAIIKDIKKKLKVTLGSDSTLTGSPSLLQEMQFAFSTGLADAREILDMVTTAPARIFNLPDPHIRNGMKADLVVTRKKNENYFLNLQDISPADVLMVMRNGQIVLSDREFFTLKGLKFQCVVGSQSKCVQWDVQSLKKRIIKKVPQDILDRNPLWNLLC